MHSSPNELCYLLYCLLHFRYIHSAYVSYECSILSLCRVIDVEDGHSIDIGVVIRW